MKIIKITMNEVTFYTINVFRQDWIFSNGNSFIISFLSSKVLMEWIKQQQRGKKEIMGRFNVRY